MNNQTLTQRNRWMLIGTALIAMILFAACTGADMNSDSTLDDPEDTPEDSEAALDVETTTLYVAPFKKPCVGSAPQQCMMVKENVEDEWMYFYGQIEGFEFVEGFEYELLVERHEVENPPADSSSIRWVLVDVVSATEVEN